VTRLDPQRVGPLRLVPGLGAADRPVILDAHEEHSAGPVGQTNHRLDEVAVVQPFSLLALELDLIGLPASDPLRDTQASPLPDPTASPCASSLYAKLCDTIPSVSSVLFPARWAVATRLSPGRGQAVPVPDKPEAGIRGHSDSADVAGGSVLAGDHHVHLSVDSVDDIFELGYILLQRIDVG
jgi:hypothetical protein